MYDSLCIRSFRWFTIINKQINSFRFSNFIVRNLINNMLFNRSLWSFCVEISTIENFVVMFLNAQYLFYSMFNTRSSLKRTNIILSLYLISMMWIIRINIFVICFLFSCVYIMWKFVSKHVTCDIYLCLFKIVVISMKSYIIR